MIEALPHDNLDITTVDSIRLSVVSPGVSTWMKFSFERGGGTGDMRVAGQVRLPAEDWNPEWLAVSRILPQAFFAANVWESEVAIPWRTLEMEAPQPGSELPFQITRYAGNVRRTTELNRRQSTWAPVPSIWNIIDPNGFGRLIFGGDAPVSRFDSYTDFANDMGGIKGALTAPAPHAKLTGRIWHTMDYQKVFGETTLPVTGLPVSWESALAVSDKQPVMMRWSLADDTGDIAASQMQCDIAPPFAVDIAPIFSRDEVVFLGDLSKLPTLDGMQIHHRLYAANGQEVRAVPVPATPEFEARLSLAAFPVNTELTAESILADAEGNERYRVTKTIRNVPCPEWMNQHPGCVTAPPPGWSPLHTSQTEEGIVTEVAKHSYRFSHNFLPEDIRLAGESFAAGPMHFNIVTREHGKQEIDGGAARITAEDARGITLEWSGESADFTLQARVRVEFNANAWYEVTLTPRHGIVTVEQLGVTLPIEPERLRYMRGANALGTMEGSTLYALIGPAKTDRELPKPNMPFAVEVSGNGWKFGKSLVNFLWLGGEDRGMFFILPSRRNMNIAGDFTTVVDDGAEFSLTLHLIDTPTKFDQPFSYEFGTVLTPTRSISDPARLRRVGAAYQRLQPDGRRIMEQDPATYAKPTGWRFFHDAALLPSTIEARGFRLWRVD